jgi:hypothetical protein
MMGSADPRRPWRRLLLGVALLAGVGLTGCQSDFGGMTLPSPYYMHDDVQYFPPGPQFKLAREAAAMKQYGQGQPPAMIPQAVPAPAPVPVPPPAPMPGG